MSDKVRDILPLAMFMAIFYVLDALRVYMGLNLYIDRFVLWIIPIFIFIKYYLRQNPFECLKLNTNIKKGVLWGAIISAVHAAIYIAFWYLKNGAIAVDWNVGIRAFLDVVLVTGIIEEIVFRGFVLNYLRNIYSFRTANIVSSLLFVVAHIPYFMAWGYFSLPILKIMYEFIRLFVFGLFWGFLLKKTNSLWPCIIHHSANNFLSFMVR